MAQPKKKIKLSPDLLDDERHWDVTLISNDGGSIGATKFVLSVASPVFERMFLGNFKESKENTVNIDFHSSTLKFVVKYMYTGEFDLPSFFMKLSVGSNSNPRWRL